MGFLGTFLQLQAGTLNVGCTGASDHLHADWQFSICNAASALEHRRRWWKVMIEA